MRAAFTLSGNAKTCAPSTSYSSSSFLSSASSLIRRRNERSERRVALIRASSSDAKPSPNTSSSSTSKVSEDDESFTLADVGEDSTLAEKRNEFQEAIAKAQTEQKEKKMFDEKSESSTWEVKGTEASSSSSSSSPPPPPPVAKPLTDLSPINVDATAIEKEKKRNDDDGDKDEPLRMIGSAPVKSSSGEPTFSKQLSRTVKALVPEGASAATVLKTTKRFMEAYEAGLTPEEQIGYALGVPTDKLNETQKKYAPLVAEKLKENAMQLKGELLAATNLYEAGIQAYSVGQYPKALKFFGNALEETSDTSLLGGKIQIYKALTLYALRRLEECIDLYTFLEGTHPIGSIRRQAGELKYIAEAPRLELEEDEYVDVPAGVKDANRYRGYGKVIGKSGKPKVPKTYTEEAMERVNYAKYAPNRLQLIGWTAVAIGLALYGAYVTK
ncbi:unnamed protein product [Bathycoccus prasinos]